MLGAGDQGARGHDVHLDPIEPHEHDVAGDLLDPSEETFLIDGGCTMTPLEKPWGQHASDPGDIAASDGLGEVMGRSHDILTIRHDTLSCQDTPNRSLHHPKRELNP